MNAFFKLMLKGSALSALALVTAAAGCSDSNKDTTPGAGGDSGGKAGSASQAGGTSKSGSTNAAGDGTGGASGGATSGGAAATDAGAGGVTTETGGAGDGGAGGGGGAASDPAIARFCNDLTFGTQQNPTDTTMVLEIGEGADKVTFTATTGHCAPVDGAACTPIPIGTDVPVTLFDADNLTLVIDSGTIDTASGENWIFYTDLSTDAEPSPVVSGAPTTDVACKDVTYSDVYP